MAMAGFSQVVAGSPPALVTVDMTKEVKAGIYRCRGEWAGWWFGTSILLFHRLCFLMFFDYPKYGAMIQGYLRIVFFLLPDDF